MRFTLNINSELYAWMTARAQTNDSDERARRIAIRIWFYELAGHEAPAKVFQSYSKAWSVQEPIRLQIDLTDEAGVSICELVGVDSEASAMERNRALTVWLYTQAGLSVPKSKKEAARDRYWELKRKAEAYDAMVAQEASDD